MTAPGEPLVDFHDLKLEFPIYGGAIQALNGVTLNVGQGEIVGVVGESGCGKSVTAMMALRLLPEGGYRITGGSARIIGRDLQAIPERDMTAIRGRRIAMIFQEPQTALNPTKKIGAQMIQVIRRHQDLDHDAARKLALSLLSQMWISEPEHVLDAYPFALSGGMRQRVLIAMAFSCEPSLIIADEPTTALDVTVQKQVLLLLRAKAKERGVAVLLISHDMAVVSQLCDRVYVMYAGQVIESGPTRDVITSPKHPYTQALLAATPQGAAPGATLRAIAGSLPNLVTPPSGCLFRERCDVAFAACARRPALSAIAPPATHLSACWLTQQHGEPAP
ncbi:ABC transporter ATP-binding protein [Varunaivibrio sulfuroxidans]|uniref:Peptide/nickel transport system ATP-binding protein n=1 Tax=Varunaivibrio sulfuroxidans TaxID=1773489 RepID=A0A4V2UNI0_9PROT|nr:ABC transporter ATP-binding protein [Varunaivibrio sulfuroxidans]TCS62181.1 peptide/nickel transport system ATP-binding protein [Varunaivibrio sulfuroxidans]WES30608.1 ABC transporter ATP-binding protein [Varunaivibrio sulfuroxidans]